MNEIVNDFKQWCNTGEETGDPTYYDQQGDAANKYNKKHKKDPGNPIHAQGLQSIYMRITSYIQKIHYNMK